MSGWVDDDGGEGGGLTGLEMHMYGLSHIISLILQISLFFACTVCIDAVSINLIAMLYKADER